MSVFDDAAEKRILNESHDLEVIRDIALRRRRRIPGCDGEIERAINVFLPEGERNDPARRSEVMREVEDAMRANLISPEEFFLYNFQNLNERGRREFVGDIERAILCARIYSSVPQSRVMFSKYETYEAFRGFFKRDAILADPSDGALESKVSSFLSRHPSAIVKPDRGSRGDGVLLIREAQGADRVSSVAATVRRLGTCIVEELISQSDEMAVFHPESVNTVRCASYLSEEGDLSIICAVLRMGTGNKPVDNGGAGGICASVDADTGIVAAEGATETGGRYLIHPDSGVQIIGSRVPRWQDLLGTVEKLASVIPDQRYVGWDLALTDDGWTLVEANAGGQWEICQMSDRRGLREVIEKTLGML